MQDTPPIALRSVKNGVDMTQSSENAPSRSERIAPFDGAASFDGEASPVFRRCWFLTGPTASGKSEVAAPLAEQLGAEIISLDSMAVYRGMNIGTAKPTDEERRRVPHHLLDVVDPTEEFSVSQYVESAQRAVAGIHAAGGVALFVGGTPLYLKALLRGIYHGPPADWEFRRSVEEEVRRVGTAALLERLGQVDPVSAARLHPNDQRRIIRALEVYKITGQPLSHQQVQFEEGLPAECCRVFVLGRPRGKLHDRIQRRVDGMFEAGLIDEVRGLLDRFEQLGRTASQAVGSREVIDQLAGKCDRETAIELVKARTRQFARRQETWFRSLSECRRLDADAAVGSADLVREIVALGLAADVES